MKEVSFNNYIKEILLAAEYKKDDELDCVVAFSQNLRGCMTQGNNYEEARDNLIDAIELWITIALREGEVLPVVNSCTLASSIEKVESNLDSKRFAYV